MIRARAVKPRRDRHADIVAVGVPALAVRDEDREHLENLICELLLDAGERDQETAR